MDSNKPNKSIEALFAEQIDAQNRLIEATERRVKAEVESALKSQEAIEKQKEAITISISSKLASEKLILSIEKLIVEVQGAVVIAKPLELVIGKIDILIQILQILVQMISQINGVSKDNIEKLQDQLYKLAELNALAAKGITIQQSSSTVGSVDAKQANIADNLNALQKDLDNSK